jgi:hypothetical protein
VYIYISTYLFCVCLLNIIPTLIFHDFRSDDALFDGTMDVVAVGEKQVDLTG